MISIKLALYEIYDGYRISLNGNRNSYLISDKLNIPQTQYNELLKSLGATWFSKKNIYLCSPMFDNIEDAQRAIDYIESLFIMEKLV